MPIVHRAKCYIRFFIVVGWVNSPTNIVFFVAGKATDRAQVGLRAKGPFSWVPLVGRLTVGAKKNFLEGKVGDNKRI